MSDPFFESRPTLGFPLTRLRSSGRWNRNRTASPLLRLPPEIRNRIYELVLSVGIISVHHRPVAHRWRVNNSNTNNNNQGRHETIPGGFYCRRLGASQNPWIDTRHSATRAEERGVTLLSPVCRQLYRETALLPFQLNAWCFESVKLMERYVVRERRLPLEQRRAVRTLYADSPFTKAVHKCFGELEVVVCFSRWTGLRRTVLPPGGGRKGEAKRVQQVRSKQAMELFDT